MSERSTGLLLYDMVEAANNIKAYVAGMSFDVYVHLFNAAVFPPVSSVSPKTPL
jgi:hypothetical protein